MNKKQEIKEAIQSVIKEMMDRVMHRVLVDDPFSSNEHKAKNLFTLH